MRKERFPLRDIDKFTELFASESDRAAAVLARGLMEERLKQLLIASFVEGAGRLALFEGDAPLASFSARIRVAEAVGLVPRDQAADLHIVRTIGNDFAHGLDHTMTFEERSIRDRVFAMSAPRFFFDYPGLTDAFLDEEQKATFQSSCRWRYQLGVGWLDSLLAIHINRAKHAEPAPSLGSLTERGYRAGARLQPNEEL